ncbi:MAG: asparagine synthase (glutamine-hydrolyzing), partial [Stellaceae bacterium]
MCGLTGFLDSGPAPRESRAATVAAMTQTLHHRGPDDGGVWIDDEAGIALGHRRLSIIDLSPLGHQPMVSADGRYVVVFNGEIYNFNALSEQLKQTGETLRGHSDTEVLLEAVALWGVERAIGECEGMFAIAFWDRRERRLTLARDRAGIKPLYWGRMPDGTFLFGSELKALRRHPSWRGEIDRDALALFMRFGYVPAPRSIYRNVFKLEPGALLTVTRGAAPRLERYWDAAQMATHAMADPVPGAEADAIATLEQLMLRSVANEMISDVPLGAFLSGGIDSSLVTALMQSMSPRPIKTFTIGFHSERFDEATHAAAVAKHLGTEHTELYVSDEAVRAVIPNLPVWYDEPFADASQIPTYLVSRLARDHVTVALSGDGGDELFAGYPWYRWGRRFDRAVGAWPLPLRRGAGRLLSAMPNPVAGAVTRLLPAKERPRDPAQSMKKLGRWLEGAGTGDFHRQIRSIWEQPESLVPGAHEFDTGLSDPALARTVPAITERMMLADMMVYLPDDILTKVDRASMAVGLEVRVPLLNHRIVEYAWRLPLAMKLRGTTTKWAMRQILYRHVPPHLIERPKQGFMVPLDEWLRGPLDEWVGDLLAPATLRRQGFLDPSAVAARLDEHRRGQRDWGYALWTVAMFQSWLAREQDYGGVSLPGSPSTTHAVPAAV